MQTTEEKILKSLNSRGRGSVTTPNDFIRFGTRSAIDLALHRLVQNGTIRRIGRGIYDYPKIHPTLGPLFPSIDAIAQAMAGKDRLRLQPTGAYAANLLGLSEQVPAKIVYLTDGPNRVVKVGGTEIRLRRTTPRNMAAAGRLSGLVIQALRYLGQANVTPHHIAHLKRTIPADQRRGMLKDIPIAPGWMRPILQELSEP